jgi:hypothetical protein
VGLSEGVQRRMAARIEARFDMRLRDLALPDFAPLLQVPLRIFHDVGDREVVKPAVSFLAEGRPSNAWPAPELLASASSAAPRGYLWMVHEG